MRPNCCSASEETNFLATPIAPVALGSVDAFGGIYSYAMADGWLGLFLNLVPTMNDGPVMTIMSAVVAGAGKVTVEVTGARLVFLACRHINNDFDETTFTVGTTETRKDASKQEVPELD